MSEETAYRVELERFSGPMDLLLYLLKEDELEIETIPVARVCDRYLEYIEDLDRIDIDAAGDFLVMASTLVRMKSRALLPSDVQVLEDEDLDPRFELVRQLIQYRRFKQVAETLAERRAEAARRFDRGMHPELGERPARDASELPIDGASAERLFAAFARLLRETRGVTRYIISTDDTPMEEHLVRLDGLLPPGERRRFGELVPKDVSRGYLIGVFLALLELLKRQRLSVEQDEEFGEIYVLGREPEPLEEGEARTP